MLLTLLLAASALVGFAKALGQEQIISFTSNTSTVQLIGGPSSPTIMLDGADWPGVLRVGQDLAADFGRVTGKNLIVALINGTSSNASMPQSASGPMIIAGTVGKSSLIQSMITAGKLNVSEIKGQWESFQTQVISNPMEGVESAVVIAGSDKRGSIYGMYDISEQIGISPWYWWADVPAVHQTEIYIMNVTKVQGPPSVKYRGFFLNDEQPSLNNWVQSRYPNLAYGDPGFGHSFYSLVFELLLRLRANYLWPAEWNNMFNVDDPANEPLADDYGIVMGTSHTEPLMRATKEQELFLNGSWNWVTNQANVSQFLVEGAERAKPYEGVYTMGMRGLGDTASPTINASVLQTIINSQQRILSNVFNTSDLSSIPQMWCLYKEVGGYYAQGLQVPDQITLLWADDNFVRTVSFRPDNLLTPLGKQSKTSTSKRDLPPCRCWRILSLRLRRLTT